MGSRTGRAEPHDLPVSGCSIIPVGPEVLQCADDIICNDWHVLTHQLMLSFSISKGSQSHIT